VAVAGNLYSFYRNDGGLFWRQYRNDAWSDDVCIRKDGVVSFSVSICDGGGILILCQTSHQVEKILFDKGVLTTSSLVGGGLAGSYYGVHLGDETFLVHNIPVTAEYSQILMSHRVSAQGLWSDSKHLGRILPFEQDGQAFYAVPVKGQHFLVFYQAHKGGFNADLGYREVYGEKMGEFNIVQQSANVSGQYYSFLATTQGIHMLYTARGMMNSSLIYRRKDINGLSSKITVSQGNNIHSPLLYIVDDELFLMFMRGDEVFVSSVQGDNIIPPTKVENTINITLCKFIQDSSTKTNLNTNNLYVDTNRPWEIQFFTDIYNIIKKPSEKPLTLQIGNQQDYENLFSPQWDTN